MTDNPIELWKKRAISDLRKFCGKEDLCISCHKRKKQRYSDYCKSCYEEGYEIVKHEESKNET